MQSETFEIRNGKLYRKKKNEKIVVFDFGGGTFILSDLSSVQSPQGRGTLVSTDGRDFAAMSATSKEWHA